MSVAASSAMTTSGKTEAASTTRLSWGSLSKEVIVLTLPLSDTNTDQRSVMSYIKYRWMPWARSTASIEDTASFESSTSTTRDSCHNMISPTFHVTTFLTYSQKSASFYQLRLPIAPKLANASLQRDASEADFASGQDAWHQVSRMARARQENNTTTVIQ